MLMIVYLVELVEINLRSELSRVIPATTPKFGREEDAWGFRQTSSINIDGRHMLNVWRLVRSEVDLNVYTFENVAFHILHQRYVLLNIAFKIPEANLNKECFC